jgi:hypothetical protein
MAKSGAASCASNGRNVRRAVDSVEASNGGMSVRVSDRWGIATEVYTAVGAAGFGIESLESVLLSLS